MALRKSDVDEQLIDDLMAKLVEGLREGGRSTRWLLYAAVIKSVTRSHRPAQLPASLGVLAALAGESIVLVGSGDGDADGDGGGTTGMGMDTFMGVAAGRQVMGLEQMLAEAFNGSVKWHRGRDPVGRRVPAAAAAVSSSAAAAAGTGDDARRGSSRRRREAACDTAQVWLNESLVASITYADDSWRPTHDPERPTAGAPVCFQLPSTSRRAAHSPSCGAGDGVRRLVGRSHFSSVFSDLDLDLDLDLDPESDLYLDLDVVAAETRAGLPVSYTHLTLPTILLV